MRRVGLIGELVTSLHQPFLTLLRTEANKGGRGLGWGIRRPQRAQKRKPARQCAEFRHAERAIANSAVASSLNPLSRQFQRRCKGVNRRMSFVGVFQVGCEQSGVISGHDGS